MNTKILAVLLTVVIFTQAKSLHQILHDAELACCPEGYIFDTRTLSCVCPANLPHKDAGGNCVSCHYPGIWIENDKHCLICDKGRIPNK